MSNVLLTNLPNFIYQFMLTNSLHILILSR